MIIQILRKHDPIPLILNLHRNKSILHNILIPHNLLQSVILLLFKLLEKGEVFVEGRLDELPEEIAHEDVDGALQGDNLVLVFEGFELLFDEEDDGFAPFLAEDGAQGEDLLLLLFEEV